MLIKLSNKKTTKTGFSLIELAVVITIIAALVAVVANTNRISFGARLAAAQSLTKSSPVIDMDNGDLILWLETTMSNSFGNAPGNNTTISTWQDLSPTHNNATAGTAPTYLTNTMNGLPTISFDGSSTYLKYSGSYLAGSNYTIFVVEQRTAAQGSSADFIGGPNATTNNMLQLGYNTDTKFIFGQYGNDCLYNTFPAYTTPTPNIHGFIFNSATGKNWYLNGGAAKTFTTACPSPTTGLSSGYTVAYIGSYYTNSWYHGQIGEIIMFKRALNENEQNDIQQYLGKKWGISVSYS